MSGNVAAWSAIAVRRIVRKLSSKCAIVTPMSCRAGALDALQPCAAIANSSARTTRLIPLLLLKRGRDPPDPVSAAMAIPIGHDSRDDHATFDDVLDVGVKSDKRESARHDSENDRPDDRSGNPANTAGEARAADDGGRDGIELV